jgi:hypothetical protein
MPAPRIVKATGHCPAPARRVVQFGSRRSDTVVIKSPATSVIPLDNKVAVCPERPVLRLPVAVHVPVVGSYSSAVAEAVPLSSNPPATRNHPVRQQGRRMPITRRVEITVAVQMPVAGSYSSALSEALDWYPLPAASSTMPLGSKVAVCRLRAVFRSPVGSPSPAYRVVQFPRWRKQ